jgi:hypothetical protein
MYINKNFWQMRAILFIYLFIYLYKNPLHASKSYFSGCKNAKIGPKKRKTTTVELVTMVFLFSKFFY